MILIVEEVRGSYEEVQGSGFNHPVDERTTFVYSSRKKEKEKNYSSKVFGR